MLKDFWASKKWKAVLAAVLTAVGSGLTETMDWKTVVFTVIGSILTGVAFQGVADVGKSKALIEANK